MQNLVRKRRFPADANAVECLFIAGAWGIALMWLLVSIAFPFGWDHGIMAVGGDVIVGGGLPYRDAWDMKGPVAPYVFGFAQFLFGHTMWGIRVLDAALFLSAALVLARTVSRLASPVVGAWAGATFLLWYASHGWFYTSQPDGWVSSAMILGVCPLLEPVRPVRLRNVAAAGVVVGLAALVKPHFAAMGLVPLLAIAFMPLERGRKNRYVAILFATAAIPPLIAVSWFGIQGGLGAFIEVHFQYPADTYGRFGRLSASRIGKGLADFFLHGPVAVLTAAILIAFFVLRGRPTTAAAMISWFGVVLICVSLQGRFWPYHWLIALAPFTLLGAIGLHGLAKSSRLGAIFAYVSFALFIVPVSYNPSAMILRGLQFAAGLKDDEWFNDQFRMKPYVAGDQVRAAAYLRQVTQPDDPVYIWGNEATVAYLADRRAPTRFIFSMPLVLDGKFRNAYRREVLEDLTATPPAYIVVGIPYYCCDKQGILQKFPALNRFLHEGYRFDRSFGFLDLYQRKALSGRPKGS